MSFCVECHSDDLEDVQALADDYLCQEHRDILEGVRYCAECRKRWIPAPDDGSMICTSCADKQKCEYCGKLYSEKYLISRAKPKQKDKKREFAYGVRFKGLCKNCKEIALNSVPITLEGHMLAECPMCNHQWDAKIVQPLDSFR